MGYSIYLKFGTKFKLPVNPEEIEIEQAANYETYDVLGIGEVLANKRAKLKVISWESFFPAHSDTFVNSSAKDPEYYIKKIESALKQRTIGRIIISRGGSYDTNMRCIITDFITTDKGGEPGDIYYEISFMQYRDYAPKTISIVTTTPETQTAEAAAETERAVETPVLRVGAAVIANGSYCYDSYGSKPHGTANNLSTTITRIVEGNPYPVHIGSYGWLTADQLQITG